MTSSCHRIPFLLGGLFVTPALYAAHPLITEDTATQGRGNFQFEPIAGLIWSARKDLDLDLGYRLESSDALCARALLAGVAVRW